MCPPGREGELQGAWGAGVQAGYSLQRCEDRCQVVVFYPSDWEEGSEELLSAFSAVSDQFQRAGGRLFGCSTDSVASHLAWTRADLRPGFPLLSDPCGRLADRFGLFDPDELVARPGVVVLDSRGEELEVVSSSLAAAQLASYCLGLVEQGAQVAAKGGAGATKSKPMPRPLVRTKAPVAPPKAASPAPKAAGSKAVNHRWTKIVSRFEEPAGQRPAAPSKLRLLFPPCLQEDQRPEGKARPRPPPRCWSAPAAPRCPVCTRAVYPLDQVMAADRKPFHRACIGCQARGCPNQLTTRSMHRVDGLVVCAKCEASLHPAEFGPPAYKETPEELAMREERKAAREEAPGRIIREMEALMGRAGVQGAGGEQPVGRGQLVGKLEGLEDYCVQGI